MGFKQLSDFDDWQRQGSIDDFTQIDSKGYMIQHWTKFIKFGFQRVSDMACRFVREGKLTKEQALQLIKDSDYFYWLKENYQKILDRDYDTLFTMIYNSCNVKRKVVEEDPKEKGDRALLNFGHTIGHAVEKLKNFTLLHGECVSIGIVSAAYISLVKNYINNTEFNDICDTLKLFKLPVTTSDINANDVVEATLNDKKMDSGVIKFIVLKEIGNASIDRTIDHDLLIYSCEKIIEK